MKYVLGTVFVLAVVAAYLFGQHTINQTHQAARDEMGGLEKIDVVVGRGRPGEMTLVKRGPEVVDGRNKQEIDLMLHGLRSTGPCTQGHRGTLTLRESPYGSGAFVNNWFDLGCT